LSALQVPQGQFFSISDRAARSRLSSDLVISADWGFVSGVLPIDLQDDRVAVPELVEHQTRKILENLETILKAHGMDRHNVVSVRIHLAQFKRFYDRMNSAYVRFFASERLPACSCVGVEALPRGALVEMDFVVRLII
jgi:enamine deaminase RidA (YjgF/YER057c/UK114 family)